MQRIARFLQKQTELEYDHNWEVKSDRRQCCSALIPVEVICNAKARSRGAWKK